MKRVFAHIGFSVAVTLIVLCFVNPEYVSYISVGLAALFAVSLSLKKYREAVTLPLCISSALFACLLFLCVYNYSVLPALSLSGKEGTFSYYITELPQFSNGKYIYTVKTQSVLIDGAPQRLNLRLISKTPITAQPYVVCNSYGSFTSIAENAFSSYGYWSDGIYLSVRVQDFSVSTERVHNLFSYILYLRNDIIETFMKTMKGDTGALSAALVTGDRYYLSDELRQAFQLSGSSHIIAVSGLHISVVTGGIYFLLKNSGINKRLCSVIIILITLLYMSLADFSGSVVRAGNMMIVLLSADFFKRKADSLNSLGFAVFIICINPFAVCDVGAVLSVLSVLSLIVYYPFLNDILLGKFDYTYKKRDNRLLTLTLNTAFQVYKYIVISVCVLTFTLPVMYLFFGYVSLVGVFSNVSLLPLASISTVLSFITYVFCRINVFSELFVFICSFFNRGIIRIVKDMSEAKVLTVAFSPYFAFVLAALLIVAAIGFIAFKGRLNKTVIAFTYIVLAAALVTNLYSQKNNADMLITENGACAIVCDGKTVVCGVDDTSDYYSIKSFIVPRSGKITVLIDNKNSKNSAALCKALGAQRVVLSEQSKYYEDYLISDNYSATLSDGFEISSYNSDGIKLSVKGKSVYLGNADAYADIRIINGKVYDENGVISLDDSNVIYSVNKNYYVARR